MNKGLKEEVKMVINSLLVPFSRGLHLDRLMKEYADYEMKPLPFRELGYDTPLAFLLSIPDVVSCTRLPSGHIVLRAVANKQISHIQELVQGQKKPQNSSFRVIQKVLHSQSLRNQAASLTNGSFTSPPVDNKWNGNQGPKNFLQNGRSTYSNQTVHTSNGASSSVMSHSRTCSSLEYEVQLVFELKKILQSFPEGVELPHVSVLYNDTYKKQLTLDKIEYRLTLQDFFEKHHDVFRMWNNNSKTFVSLSSLVPSSGAASSNTTNHGPRERISPTGAIPKTSSPVSFAPPPAEFNRIPSAPTKWTATDIRVRSPTKNSFQTIGFIPPAGLNPDYQSIRKASPARVRSLQSPVDSALLQSFGAQKPRVKNVCQSDTEIPHELFPSDISDFEYFYLIVAEVISPGEFYWFFNDSRKVIESLTDDMTLLYSSNDDYRMSRSEMYIGQLVAAMYTDNLWYRARIIGCYQEEFLVFFLDYGSKNYVNIARIRHLDLQFTKLPLQAFRGRIFGICPLPDEKKWSTEAGKWFLDLIKGSKVIAAAKMAEEKSGEDGSQPLYALTLVDTTGAKDVHINDYLIDNGFAAPCPKDALFVVQLGSSASVVESPESSPSQPLPAQTPPLSPSKSSLSDKESSPAHMLNHEQKIQSPSPVHLDCQTPPVVCAEETVTTLMENLSIPATPDIEESAQGYIRPCVKELVLEDDRKLYVIEYNGDLYLSKSDILMLIPNLDRRMATIQMKVDTKLIDIQTDPQVFTDCVKTGAPWIKDSEGKVVSQLVLYSMQHVSPLFFIFNCKDKIASSAIETEIREYNDA